MDKLSWIKVALGVTAAAGVGITGSVLSETVRNNMSGGKIVKFLVWVGFLGLTTAAGTVAANSLIDTVDTVHEIVTGTLSDSEKE